MCQTIVINKGEIQLQTVKQFKEYFMVDNIFDNTGKLEDDLIEDCCLCQIDIETNLHRLNITFFYDYCDYYIDMKAITNAPTVQT